MTDKQIIIDGVDIKDCKRRIGKDNFCRYYKRPCTENNYNCIWKKYLRKEQECEELKSDLTDLSKIIDCKNGTILTFKEQLDQLKASKEQAEQKIEKIRQVCAETKDVGENIKDMYTAKLSGLYLKSRQILQIINEVNDDIKIS